MISSVPTFLAEESLAQTFGVSWPAFIAQVLSFLIVLYVLSKYAFGPIINILEERRRRIEEGQANAEKIKAQLAESETRYRQLLDEANQQAQKIIDEARRAGEALGLRGAEEAATEGKRILARAQEETRLEHDRVLSEVKRELGRLIIETTAKVTGKVLTPEDQARLSEETARQLA